MRFRLIHTDADGFELRDRLGGSLRWRARCENKTRAEAVRHQRNGIISLKGPPARSRMEQRPWKSCTPFECAPVGLRAFGFGLNTVAKTQEEE
jgi:hypothetical protein